MMRIADVPMAGRQVLMVVSFWCFLAVCASCTVFIKKRRAPQTALCIFCGILGYSCLQVLIEVSRMFGLHLTREGLAGRLTELPALIIFSCFFLFASLSVAVAVPAVKLLKTEWTFPHFSKLKVQLHDTFGLSIVATKAYYDGQDIDRDTVRTLFSRCRECFTDRDLFVCRTYESIYDIGRFIGVSLHINGALPEGEKVKPIVCAALSECMINTFTHAWGNAVFVSVSEDKDTVIVISNNGKAPKGGIAEKGGLKHLRELIEEIDGLMEVSSTPHFSLTLSLPKED